MTTQPIPEGFGQQDDTFDDQKPPIQFGPPDLTLFEGSDVAINTLLFSEDGHPQGRLVSIVVHNFGEIRAIKDYRATDLTNDSLLDNLQQGINATVQAFLFQLTETRRKKLEEHAKVKPAPSVALTLTPPNPPQKGVAKAATVQPSSNASPKSVAKTTTVNQPSSNGPKKGAAKVATVNQLEMF